MARHIGLRWRLLTILGLVFLTLASCVTAQFFELRQTILQEREAKMRDMVQAAERLVAAIDAQVRSAGGTVEQAQQQAAAALRAMRWGDGDYYGVYRSDGLTLVHGNPQNEGKKRLNYVDPEGNHPVANIIAMAAAGGGTITYMVPRASGGTMIPKLTHVGRYQPWDWAIQAGVYLDDIKATLLDRAIHLGMVALAILAASGFALWSVSRSIARYQERVIAAESMARDAEGTRRSELRLRSLIKNATDVILICDRQGAIHYHSPAAETAWGFEAAALTDRSLFSLVHPSQVAIIEEMWIRVQAAPGVTSDIELQLCDAAGAWRYAEVNVSNLLHEGAVDGIVVTAHDIDERKTFERRLEQQAFHDSLTGLPNRALFHDRVDHALTRAGRRQSGVGLLFLDLDGFKLINDSLGHHAGDQLLVDVARRLQSGVRAEDTVARLGGDEFVILLENMADQSDILPIVDGVAKQFVQAFEIGGRDLVVTCSIGVALGQGSQADAEDLLRQADSAMYLAKSGGKGRCLMFDPSMQSDALARLELENGLRLAMDRNELRVHYQPIVSLQTKRMVEVEALVRWQHPTRGLLSPAAFIPLAEETGLIVPLGQWVLEQACRQAVLWHRQFPSNPALVVGVNLSLRQFQTPALATQVEHVLQNTALPPGCLKLEITESMIMCDVEATILIMGQLKTLGVQLAIDDFGTGYSSLSYLKRLPLDVLKIDRSFVNGIGDTLEDTTVMQAIISLAKSLGLSVTGEGIETAEQDTCLTRWGCDLGQGYYHGRPSAADVITTLIGGEIADGSLMAAA